MWIYAGFWHKFGLLLRYYSHTYCSLQMLLDKQIDSITCIDTGQYIEYDISDIITCKLPNCSISQYVQIKTIACILKAHNEWRFNLMSFSWVSMLFLNSWRVSSHIVRYDMTSGLQLFKNSNDTREKLAQIELPLIECEREWAFRMQAYACSVFWHVLSIFAYNYYNLNKPNFMPFAVNFRGVLN
jgi:hypothetical protein